METELIEVSATIRGGSRAKGTTSVLEYVTRSERGMGDLSSMIAATSAALWGYVGGQLEPVEMIGGELEETASTYQPARLAGELLVQCLRCQAVFPDVQSHEGCEALPTDRVRLYVDRRDYDRVIDAWGARPAPAERMTPDQERAFQAAYAKAKADAIASVYRLASANDWRAGQHLMRPMLESQISDRLRGDGVFRPVDTRDVARDAVSELVAAGQLLTHHDDSSCVSMAPGDTWGPDARKAAADTLAFVQAQGLATNYVLGKLSEAERFVASSSLFRGATNHLQTQGFGPAGERTRAVTEACAELLSTGRIVQGEHDGVTHLSLSSDPAGVVLMRKRQRARADGVGIVLKEFDAIPAATASGMLQTGLVRRVRTRLSAAWSHDPQLDFAELADAVVTHMVDLGQLVRDGEYVKLATA